MKRWIFLLFFLLITKAYSQELHFENIGLKNLPSRETYSTFQDSKGFIWICTDAGLCRYDGNAITTFTTADGLSENVVLKVYEDRKGKIWFATLSGTFFYYSNARFHPIAANATLKNLFGAFSPNSFFIGEQDTLYCAPLLHPGFLKVCPQNNYKQVIVDTVGTKPNHGVLLVNKLNMRESVLGSGGEPRIGSCYKLNWNGKIVCLPIKEDYKYANTSRGQTHKNGNAYMPFGPVLNVLQKNNSKIEQYTFPEEIITIYVDRDDDIWVCTKKKGGYLFKHGDLRSKPIRFLGQLSITSVTLDQEGIVWVSTLEKGVLRSNSKNVFSIPHPDDPVATIQGNSGQLNLSYQSGKISSFFKNDSTATRELQNNQLLRKHTLTYAFIEKAYSYYCYSATLYYDDHKKSSRGYARVPLNIGAKEIVKLKNDTLLVISTRAIFLIHHAKVIHYITPPFSINHITKLRDGTILLSSRNDKGIFEFKNNAFLPYLSSLKKLSTRTNSIAEDKEGNLWIATNEHGLYCVDRKGKLYEFNEHNGLITNKINALVLDSKNNLWAATNVGLIKISYTENLGNMVIINFNQSHGLPDLLIENILEFDGNIWCTTKENAFYFKSDELKRNVTPPLTYLKTIQVNDQLIPLTDTLITNYDKNNMRIQLTLIAFRDPEKKEFLYKLIGYDNSWRYSNTGDLQYTNMSYGSYALQVYGLNNDKIKSNNPATFLFIIKKPFWYTWWFITLEIISLGTLFYLYFRYWRTKIEKREREKTAVNHKISEFKMTALRAQMNPHFIYNAIGSIQHYILKNEIDQSFNYLSKFSMLIRKILNNSRNEYISLSQEISTLQLYIELEQIRFQYPFKFVVEIDEELDMEMDIPTMLIQPYIENSIWHGLMPKETEGLLELLLKKRGDTLLVIIRDNGVGMERGDLTKKYHISKGMSLTEQRIQTLERTSNKKFVTTIIDLKGENGESIGTEVNLIIPIDE
jgi:hypothetical protein